VTFAHCAAVTFGSTAASSCVGSNSAISRPAKFWFESSGFWQCMDTFKGKARLEELNQGVAPWKVWNHLACSVTGNLAKGISAGV